LGVIAMAVGSAPAGIESPTVFVDRSIGETDPSMAQLT
jgi:hypothetical protein